MFKSFMSLFFDVTGAIFFILKIVVVGIGKMFAFLVGAAVSSAGSVQKQDESKEGIRSSSIDQTSCMYDDRFISMCDDQSL